MPNVLAKLGADVLGINPNVSTAGVIGFDRAVHAARLVELVKSSGANLGAMLDPDGEQLTLVDDTGHVLDDDEALLALTFSSRAPSPKASIAVPVDASRHVEELCAPTGSEVLRTKLSGTQLLEEADTPGVGSGGEHLGAASSSRGSCPPSTPSPPWCASCPPRDEERDAVEHRRRPPEDLHRPARGARRPSSRRVSSCGHSSSRRTRLSWSCSTGLKTDRRRRLDPRRCPTRKRPPPASTPRGGQRPRLSRRAQRAADAIEWILTEGTSGTRAR